MTPDNQFYYKKEITMLNQEECQFVQNLIDEKLVKTVCVSDDHYQGLKKDPGVEYD